MKTFHDRLTVVLTFVAILVMIYGITFSYGAPQEAAAAGIACFLGIMARMSQAASHHLDK
jgi:hypothetical protein